MYAYLLSPWLIAKYCISICYVMICQECFIETYVCRNNSVRGKCMLPNNLIMYYVLVFMYLLMRLSIIDLQTYIHDYFIGEANVYTLGDIGKHRVVSTKLPMAGGQSRDALIATGGTTTRLLGTFQVTWLITFCVQISIGYIMPFVVYANMISFCINRVLNKCF